MKKVIFLDIDGVLQPYAAMRLKGENDPAALRKRLSAQINPDIATLPSHTVRAVYEDWHKPSVEHLLSLLKNHGAVIILTSSWRECETLATLKTIFSIHGLENFVVGTTPVLTYRVTEIAEFLRMHPEIERFVIFDDDEFYKLADHFPDNFVLCPDEIGEKEFEKADALLGN